MARRVPVVSPLRDGGAASLPALAALGGTVVPALLYLASAGGEAGRGWAIPMATDMASRQTESAEEAPVPTGETAAV